MLYDSDEHTEGALTRKLNKQAIFNIYTLDTSKVDF